MSQQRYVSNELTHFVGRGLSTQDAQYDLMIRIIRSGWLSFPPYKQRVERHLVENFDGCFSNNEMYNPGVICFADIPAGDLAIHIRKYSRFGIAFSKAFLIERGANPVFYVALNSNARIQIEENGHRFASEEFRATFPDRHDMDMIPRARYFDRMIAEYHKLFGFLEQALPKVSDAALAQQISRCYTVDEWLKFHVFSYMKFFDAALPDNDDNNYYMEREWRIVHNLPFQISDILRIIIPAEYARRLRQDLPEYVGQVAFVE
jgi:hypothetical protein